MDKLYDLENMNEDQIKEAAYNQGWRDKEEFRGKSEDFTDARSYLSRLEESIPMMRSRFKNLESQNNEIREQMSRLIEGQERIRKEAFEKGKEQALEEISKKQLQAVEEGDVRSFRELEEKKKSIESEYIKINKADTNLQNKDNGISMNDQIKIEAFKQTNAEIFKNPDIHADFLQYVEKYQRIGLGIDEILNKSKEATMKIHSTNNNGHNNVISRTSGNGNTSGFMSLDKKTRDSYDSIWRDVERRLTLKYKHDLKDDNKVKEKMMKLRKEFERNAIANESKSSRG